MECARRVATVLLCLALACGGVTGKDAVLTGTGSNFAKILADNNFVAVEFYASWCGHCKKLAPEWEKAAADLKENKPPITLVKVEATEEDNKELAAKYGVQGFPTIKIFKDGNAESPVDYGGPRDHKGIVDYLVSRAGPATTEITSASQVDELKESDTAVLGVFTTKHMSERETFSRVADSLRDDFKFGHTYDSKLAGKDTKAPGLVLYKHYDEPWLAYSGSFTEEAIKAWLEEKAAPLVAELDSKPRNNKAVSAMFSKPSTKVVVIFAKDSKDAKAFSGATHASAIKNSKLKHLVIDPKANEQALKFFDLEKDDVPVIAIQNEEDDKFIKTKIKPAEIHSFIEEFQAGKVSKRVKSEEPPAKNDGPVTVVTANTFDEIVHSGNDVLIEFYAPWCGHCKQLAPTFEKVGKAFAKNSTVTIAKMDATANDVPKTFEVRGFPTIMFVNGKDGSHVSYAGDRSEADMIAYVERRGAAAAGLARDDEEDYYADAGHDEL